MTDKWISQGPCDGMCCGLHASHEEDAELAPHAREGERVVLPLVQVHQVVAYRGILLQVSPASAPIKSLSLKHMSKCHRRDCGSPKPAHDAHEIYTPIWYPEKQMDHSCPMCMVEYVDSARAVEERLSTCSAPPSPGCAACPEAVPAPPSLSACASRPASQPAM